MQIRILSILRLIKLGLVSLFYGLPQVFFALYLLKKFGTTADLHEVQKKLGVRLRKTLQASGPTFIKLGQTLATRADLVGDIVALELTNLQDKLPFFKFSLVKSTIERELKGEISELFKSVDTTPKAAASLAQVHKGRLHNGDFVAIKVLRPNIERQINSDLNILYLLAAIFTKFSSVGKTLKPHDIVDSLQKTTLRELDLRFEAAGSEQIRENIRNDKGVYIPKIYWQLTAKRVMVAQWIDGIPANDVQALLNAGHDRHEIAKKLSATFFNQAYRDGFFHADLHPGNILIMKDGTLALIDFGIIGILDDKDRIFIAQMLYGFLQRDYNLVADLHFDIGYVPANQSRALFALACRSIGEPIIGLPVNQLSIGKLLKQLFGIAKNFDMEARPQLILLQKTMLTLEGVGYSLYPEVNMWKLVEPLIKDWAADQFGYRKKIKDLKSSTIKLFKGLPENIDRAEHLLAKLDRFDFDKLERRDYKESNKTFTIILAIAAGLLLGYLIF
jgi:ubiquinone biosynthesis protein